MTTNLICFLDTRYTIADRDSYNPSNSDINIDLPLRLSNAHGSCKSQEQMQNLRRIVSENYVMPEVAVNIVTISATNASNPRFSMPNEVYQTLGSSYETGLYFPYDMNTDNHPYIYEYRDRLRNWNHRSIIGTIEVPICTECVSSYYDSCSVSPCNSQMILVDRINLCICDECGERVCSRDNLFYSSIDRSGGSTTSRSCQDECSFCGGAICAGCTDSHFDNCSSRYHCSYCDNSFSGDDDHNEDYCRDGQSEYEDSQDTRYVHQYGYTPSAGFIKKYTIDDILFLSVDPKTMRQKIKKNKKQTKHPLTFSQDDNHIGLSCPTEYHLTDINGNQPITIRTGDRRWNRLGNLMTPTTEHLLYMGVELETMGSNARTGSQASLNKFIQSDKESTVFLTNDNSVTGVEITTHPMTLDFHKKSFNWKELLSSARADGHRSGNSAGLHVHVSKNSLGLDEQSKYKVEENLTALMDIHWQQMSVLANRTSSYARKMLSADISTAESMGHLKAMLNTAIDRTKRTDKYWAINLSTGFNTFEFRIFKSTLNHNCLIGRLELVSLFCDIAVNNDLKTCATLEWIDIMRHAKKLGYKKFINYTKTKRVSENLATITGSRIPIALTR